MHLLIMHLVTRNQQRILAEAIASDSGIGLNYLEFLEIALATCEGIPGCEKKLPDLDLLNELWRIYSSLAQ
jgi:hypothetical protein